VAISYSSGLYTLSTSGSYTPADLYAYSASGITRHTGSRIIYDFGSSRITVGSGTTLTIDTDEDYGEIMFSDPGWDSSTYLHHIKVNSGGTLVIGSETTRDVCIYCPDAHAQSYRDQNRHFYIQGTLNWLGGGIVGKGVTIQVYSGSSGEISGAAWCYGIGVSFGLRLSEDDFEVLKLALYNGSIVPFVVPKTDLTGMAFFDMPAVDASQPFVGLDNDTVTGEWIDVIDWDISSDTLDRGFGFWDVRWARFVNQASGTDFEAKGNIDGNANNKGLAEIRESITFIADSGSGAKFYTEDTDNGNRLADNQICDNPDYEADRTYTLTESSGEATYDTDGGVLIGVWWRTTGGDRDDDNEFDSRGLNDDHTDIFNWLKVEYGQQPANANIVMKGNGGVETEILSLADQGITESTKATVAAYTGITPVYASGTLTVTVSSNHTWAEVYDYIKYYESENPDEVWANGKESFITTGDGVNFTGHNFELVVNSSYTVTADGVNVVADDGFTISGDFTGLISDGTDYRVPITLTGATDGSRWRVEKASDGSLIANGTQSGTGDIITYYTITANLGIVVKVRQSSGGTKYLPFESNATATTSAGATVVVSQIVDPIA
jgi:hypothetical protein